MIIEKPKLTGKNVTSQIAELQKAVNTLIEQLNIVLPMLQRSIGGNDNGKKS